MTNPRPYVYPRQDRHGTTLYNACVRHRAKGKTVALYITTTESREDATAAAQHYIATGERPAKQKTGPKRGSTMTVRIFSNTPSTGQPRNHEHRNTAKTSSETTAASKTSKENSIATKRTAGQKAGTKTMVAMNRLDLMRAIAARQRDVVPTRHW